MDTIGHTFDLLAKDVDVVLVQEHWYFDCQLHKLSLVSSEFIGLGKAVDTGDPVLPLQMPRVYCGTAVLWKRSIDHLIVTLPDGGNRIQCVEVKGSEPLLLVSVYMPCKGLQECVESFEDALAQLSEIVIKYNDSHRIIIGGDFNEDIAEPNNSRRFLLLQQFLTENDLSYKTVGKTYINPNGNETSTIDNIFYDQKMKDLLLSATYLPTFLSTYIHTYLPTYLSTNTYITVLESFLSYPTLPFLVSIEVRFGMS